jgi:ubiquitin thioesterase OTU1
VLAADAFRIPQGFTLRCIVCRQGVKGQAEAAAHAKETGHASFGEYA